MTREFHLTKRGQNPYPESGDIFMTNEPGGGEDQPPVNPQGQEIPQPAQSIELPERTETLRREWERFNNGYFESRGGARNMGIAEIRSQELIAQEAIQQGKTPKDYYKPDLVVGPAVRRSAEYDEPVNVTGYLGIGSDGREYVSIEGYAGGVPLEEIEFSQTGETHEEENPEENENEQMRARIIPILDKLYDVRPGAIMEDIINEIPPEEKDQITALLSGAEARAAQLEDLQELDAKIAEYRRDSAEFASLRIPAEILVQIGEGEISLIETPDGPRVSVPERFYTKWISRVELQRADQGYEANLRGVGLGFPVRRFANQLRDILDFTYPPTDFSTGEAGAGREEFSGRPGAGGAGGGGERPPRRPTATGPEPEEGGNEEFKPLSTEGITDSRLRAIFRQYNELGKENLLGDESLAELERNITLRLMEIDERRLELIRETVVPEGQEPPRIPEMSAEERGLVFEGMLRIREDRLALRAASTSRARRSEEDTSIRQRALDLGIQAESKQMRDIFKKEKAGEALTDDEKALRNKMRIGIEEILEEAQDISSSGFPNDILGAARHFKEIRERLITEILFKSYDDTSQTGEYEITLYGASNLDILLGYLSKDDPEKYRQFLNLKTAARYFYMMNKDLQAGNFEQFQRVAESLNYQHFEIMKKITGSAIVMRLFEKKFNKKMARDTMITDRGYREITNEVEEDLKKMNKKRAIKSEYEEERRKEGIEDGWEMKPWEISRALGVAKAFYAISYRAPEKIGVGQVPFENRRQFAGFPFESMVRVFNHNEWMLQRFRVSENSHGIDFLKGQLRRWRDLLRDKGTILGVNAIEEFGGVNVERMENAGQYKVSGIYSGWRMENMLFDKVKLLTETDGKAELTDQTIMQFMDEVLGDLETKKEMKFRDKTGQLVKDFGAAKKARNAKEMLRIQNEYADRLMPLVNGLDIGLSALIKNGDSGGQGEVAYILRRRIWERVSTKNVPIMMDYLNGIRLNGRKETAQIIKDFKAVNGREPTAGEIERGRVRGLDSIAESILLEKFGLEEWDKMSIDQRSESMKTFVDGFTEKAVVRYEKMMKIAMGEDAEDIIVDDYSTEEKKFEDMIKVEGKKLAPHLADINFPYMPFMNDIPFEVLDYEEAGSSFFKRRSGGDMGGYNAGQQGSFPIMENVAGAKPEDIFKALNEMIRGIAGPEGDQTAREAVYSWFEEYGDLIMAKPGKRQLWIKAFSEATRMPTSRAQEWSGHTAQSLIESEVGNLLALARGAGILNEELEERAKKRLGARMWNIILAIFRDILPNVPLIAGASFVNAVVKAK